jgi:hypothetical protein
MLGRWDGPVAHLPYFAHRLDVLAQGKATLVGIGQRLPPVQLTYGGIPGHLCFFSTLHVQHDPCIRSCRFRVDAALPTNGNQARARVSDSI